MIIQTINNMVCNHANSPVWSLSERENTDFHFLLIERSFPLAILKSTNQTAEQLIMEVQTHSENILKSIK